MNISKDISNKLDPSIVGVLIDVAEVATSLGIPFFVVGATARDIFFQHLYGVPTTRATMDIDVAIRVNSWSEFWSIIGKLIEAKSYQRDRRKAHRIYHAGTIIDIVPFGPIEHPTGSIAWPPDFASVMKTIGFEEALQCAIDVKISSDPDVVVKVSTPPALAIMKLQAWKDDYPNRPKDAIDVSYLLKTYIRAGNDARLFTSDEDLLTEGLDSDQESARLLGRDARLLCTEETRTIIAGILAEELAEGSPLNLLSDMMSGGFRDDYSADRTFQLLVQFNKGLMEEKGRKDTISQ